MKANMETTLHRVSGLVGQGRGFAKMVKNDRCGMDTRAQTAIESGDLDDQRKKLDELIGLQQNAPRRVFSIQRIPLPQHPSQWPPAR